MKRLASSDIPNTAYTARQRIRITAEWALIFTIVVLWTSVVGIVAVQVIGGLIDWRS